jgi:hypothetical protein
MYILAQVVLSALNIDGAHECVQGLSGTLFALKGMLLVHPGSLSITIVLFELAELLILLEQRTLVFHMAGLATSLVLMTLVTKRFYNRYVSICSKCSRNNLFCAHATSRDALAQSAHTTICYVITQPLTTL